MNINIFILGLAEKFSAALGPKGENLRRTIEDYRDELGDEENYVAELIEQRADLAPTPPGNSPSKRLNNLRLHTTYPEERKRALRARLLKYSDTIADLSGPLCEAIVKLGLTQNEIDLELERTRAIERDRAARAHDGLYAEVANQANELFKKYGVTRWHWASLTADNLEIIAKVLLQK